MPNLQHTFICDVTNKCAHWNELSRTKLKSFEYVCNLQNNKKRFQPICILNSPFSIVAIIPLHSQFKVMFDNISVINIGTTVRTNHVVSIIRISINLSGCNVIRYLVFQINNHICLWYVNAWSKINLNRKRNVKWQDICNLCCTSDVSQWYNLI